jgi:hypothetical protein
VARRYLIVNADDFGQSREVNRGIMCVCRRAMQSIKSFWKNDLWQYFITLDQKAQSNTHHKTRKIVSFPLGKFGPTGWNHEILTLALIRL